jgi:hypothetical protein
MGKRLNRRPDAFTVVVVKGVKEVTSQSHISDQSYSTLKPLVSPFCLSEERSGTMRVK